MNIDRWTKKKTTTTTAVDVDVGVAACDETIDAMHTKDQISLLQGWPR